MLPAADALDIVHKKEFMDEFDATSNIKSLFLKKNHIFVLYFFSYEVFFHVYPDFCNIFRIYSG